MFENRVAGENYFNMKKRKYHQKQAFMVTMYQPLLVGNYFQHLEHCLLKLSMIFT